MKISLKLFWMLPLMILSLVACKQKTPEDPKTLISGTTSKVWKEVKETGSDGKRIKLSSADKEARLQFFADGKFTALDETASMSGTWTYDPATKNLSLIMDNNPGVSENFTVDELTEKRMKIRSPEGVMTLDKE